MRRVYCGRDYTTLADRIPQLLLAAQEFANAEAGRRDRLPRRKRRGYYRLAGKRLERRSDGAQAGVSRENWRGEMVCGQMQWRSQGHAAIGPSG